MHIIRQINCFFILAYTLNCFWELLKKNRNISNAIFNTALVTKLTSASLILRVKDS